MLNQKVLIFSDCYIYGGSEKLMSFLLKNEILNNNYILQYSYRKHKDYEKGLKNEDLLTRKNNFPLVLMSNSTLFYKINCLKIFKFSKIILKLPFYVLDKIKFYSFWNLLCLIYLLFKTKPDLIHINNGGYPGARTCNLLVIANYLTIKSKIIYQVNNQALECKWYTEILYDKFINNNVNCFINASQRAKQQLIKNRKFDANKIKLVDNCVPLPKIRMSKSQIFNELNISLDSFLIVQVAFLSKRKGQRYLIDALNTLFEKELIFKDKVYCALVGDGEDEEFLKKHINELDLSSNIFLLGYRNNSEDFISASDLFILPSISDEDMPLVLLSALGYGKPIIATDFAGISQVIESNNNGVLINNDLEIFSSNLSNEIYNLYKDETLRTKLGTNAKQTYINYSPKNYGLKLNDIYEKI